MRQVLADSYPQTAPEEREPLPPSVLDELEGKARYGVKDERGKGSLFDRLAVFLRMPQFVGAAAVFLIAALVLLQPERPGGAIRSGGGDAGGPPVIVLHGLTSEQIAAIRTGGSFRSEQLVEVSAGTDLASLLTTRKRPNLILVDGEAGRITAPFSPGAIPVVLEFSEGETGLATMILDALAEIPEETKEESP